MNTSRNCVKLWRTRQCGKPTCLAPSAMVVSKKVVYWNAVISATEIHGYSTLWHVRADIWDFLFQWLAAVCALYTYEPAPEFHSWVSGCELFSGVQAVALAWSCFHMGWMLCTSFEKNKSAVELCQPVGSFFIFFFFLMAWTFHWDWALDTYSPRCSNTWLLALSLMSYCITYM